MNADYDSVPDGWTGVGLLMDRTRRTALAFTPDRRPHALTAGAQPEPLDPVEVNLALGAAVAQAGEDIWGSSWAATMPEAFGINRRTAARDRIERDGLHPTLLATLGELRGGTDARAMGRLLLAMGRYLNDATAAYEPDLPERLALVRQATEYAHGVLRKVRVGKTLQNRGQGLR